MAKQSGSSEIEEVPENPWQFQLPNDDDQLGKGAGGPDEEEKRRLPPWLKPLLERFFVQCKDQCVIRVVGQLDEQPLPCNNEKNDGDDDKILKFWQELLRAPKKRECTNGANKKYDLPISTKDLANSLPEKDLRRFVGFASWIVFSIPPDYHAALLSLSVTFLAYQLKDSATTPFDFHLAKSRPPHLLVGSGEAFRMFLPETAHITKFVLCYSLTWALVWPLQLEVQVFLMFLLIPAPLYFFPDLARKANGVNVDCGSFKLPLILFTTLGALGLSLICGSIALFMVYFSWRHVYARGPRSKEVEVSLDELAEVLAG